MTRETFDRVSDKAICRLRKRVIFFFFFKKNCFFYIILLSNYKMKILRSGGQQLNEMTS